MSSRTPCTQCGASKSVATYPNGTWCFSCLTKTKEKSIAPIIHLPFTKYELTRYDLIIPKEGRDWLAKYRIEEKHINKFNIGWSHEHDRLVFPYIRDDYFEYAWMRCVLNSSQHRKFGNNCPKWVYTGNKKDLPYYCLRNKTKLTKTLIITEDVVSAIRCNDFADTLALGGVSLDGAKSLQTVLKYNHITIWLDGDNPGLRAAQCLRKKFQALRSTRIIKTKKDPKEYSNREIKEVLDSD